LPDVDRGDDEIGIDRSGRPQAERGRERDDAACERDSFAPQCGRRDDARDVVYTMAQIGGGVAMMWAPGSVPTARTVATMKSSSDVSTFPTANASGATPLDASATKPTGIATPTTGTTRTFAR